MVGRHHRRTPSYLLRQTRPHVHCRPIIPQTRSTIPTNPQCTTRTLILGLMHPLPNQANLPPPPRSHQQLRHRPRSDRTLIGHSMRIRS